MIKLEKQSNSCEQPLSPQDGLKHPAVPSKTIPAKLATSGHDLLILVEDVYECLLSVSDRVLARAAIDLNLKELAASDGLAPQRASELSKLIGAHLSSPGLTAGERVQFAQEVYQSLSLEVLPVAERQATAALASLKHALAERSGLFAADTPLGYMTVKHAVAPKDGRTCDFFVVTLIDFDTEVGRESRFLLDGAGRQLCVTSTPIFGNPSHALLPNGNRSKEGPLLSPPSHSPSKLVTALLHALESAN